MPDWQSSYLLVFPESSSVPLSHALTVWDSWDSGKERTRDVMVDEMPAEMVSRASVDFRAQPTAPECRQKRVYADHAGPAMVTNRAPGM